MLCNVGVFISVSMAAQRVNPFVQARAAVMAEEAATATLADAQFKQLADGVAKWIISALNKTGTLKLRSTNLSIYADFDNVGYSEKIYALNALQPLIIEAGFGCVHSTDGEGVDILTITPHPQ